jgi:hypothetical protein
MGEPTNMMYGDQLLLEAWLTLFDEIRHSGEDLIRSSDLPVLDRVEGLRHLTRLIQARIEIDMEGIPDYPVFVPSEGVTKKWATDSGDIVTQIAAIRGTGTYRITGALGDADVVTLATYAPKLGSPDPLAFEVTGLIETPHIDVNDDGRFELLLSLGEKPGNWLPMDVRTSIVQVRDFLHDRRHQRPTFVTIEPVTVPKPPDPLTPRMLVDYLQSAARSIAALANMGCDLMERLKTTGSPNTFDSLPPGSAPGFLHPREGQARAYWNFPPDSAVVIDLPPVKARGWTFQLCNRWGESVDYVYHRGKINWHSATAHDDGSVRIVVAHRDPRTDNWVTTAGHSEGTMVFRFLEVDESPRIATALVPLADLRSA